MKKQKVPPFSEKGDLEIGAIVAQFWGRGARIGIVIDVGRRKAQVEFNYGKIEWVKKDKLGIVHDKKLIARTLREIDRGEHGR
jgi:hypothetical protein